MTVTLTQEGGQKKWKPDLALIGTIGYALLTVAAVVAAHCLPESAQSTAWCIAGLATAGTNLSATLFASEISGVPSPL